MMDRNTTFFMNLYVGFLTPNLFFQLKDLVQTKKVVFKDNQRGNHQQQKISLVLVPKSSRPLIGNNVDKFERLID